MRKFSNTTFFSTTRNLIFLSYIAFTNTLWLDFGFGFVFTSFNDGLFKCNEISECGRVFSTHLIAYKKEVSLTLYKWS